MLTAERVRSKTARIDGLFSMEPPTTGNDLQQIFSSLNYVCQVIPAFVKTVATLHDFMDRVYDRASKRKKHAVARVQRTGYGWSDSEDKFFKDCKNALQHQVNLVHRDRFKRLCVYTNALDAFCCGIVTQIPLSNIKHSHCEQHRDPCGFLSVRFDKQQLGCATSETEGYAVLVILDRMNWLLATQAGFDLFTDHSNPIFLFDPLSVFLDHSQATACKVLRWAVLLSMYVYTCVPTKGPENV